MHKAFAASLLHQNDQVYSRIKGQSNDEKHTRFNVYRNNVFVSLIDALADIFPVTQQLVGDEFFRAMAREFVQNNLPSSPVISDYGQEFDAFIRGFTPADSVPFLADIAALEHQLLALTHTAEYPTLDHEQVSAAFSQVEDPSALRLSLPPNAHIVVTTFAIGSLYLAHKNQQHNIIATLTIDANEHLLLAKSDLYAELRVISPAESEFIKNLMEGKTLGDAIPDDDTFDLGSSLAKIIEWQLLTHIS
ncbi:putative DNA-binding domain-containing protein [Marinomonas sp. A79]|uniref:DNA-binding domain-containing protein n=1 Tax=Marinomonas vulgaris TaxID=2823372 RepID=A0ABS5HCK7_9GAMM|nr:DNA-binding domain-containing protein [Marinomonas vulgaris]MBR7889392.1 putative DNA-binding domain-containing protein [Marinomonas vulgaris]